LTILAPSLALIAIAAPGMTAPLVPRTVPEITAVEGVVVCATAIDEPATTDAATSDATKATTERAPREKQRVIMVSISGDYREGL